MSLERTVLHLKCQLAAYALETSLNVSGAVKGGLDMGQHVLSTDVLQKVRAGNEVRWLLSSSTEQERFTHLVQPIGELFKSIDAGCVERCHVAKTQDHYISKLS